MYGDFSCARESLEAITLLEWIDVRKVENWESHFWINDESEIWFKNSFEIWIPV